MVYKIVSNEIGNGELYSMFSQGDFRLRYRVDRWTYPVEHTPLFAFNTRWAAEYFAWSYQPDLYHLYLAESSGEFDAEEMMRLVGIPKNADYIQRYWDGLWVPTGDLPVGTVLCTAIKLVERVHRRSWFDRDYP